jgi:hypothetical protein
MSLRAPRLAIVPIFALAAALALPALAQPSPEDLALAKVLFEEGRKLMAEGKIDDACAKLARSHALDPALGTLLNLAVCHEKQGKTASAWAELRTAADLAAKGKETKRLAFATDRAKQLEARLARLTVRAPGAPAGLSVRLDGREIGAVSLGTALPLDPGEHRLELSAPGKRAFAVTVTLEAGPSSKIVDVPPLADEAAPSTPPPAPTAPPPATAPPPPAPPPAEGGRSVPRFAAGLATGGVGLVGLVVGSIYGVRTLQKKGEIGSSCDDEGGCNAKGYALQEDAHRSATISTVAFAVGLGAVAAGVALVVTSGSPGKPRASAWIAPAVGGISAGGSW